MYVDAIYIANQSTVKVVERVNGRRVYQDYPGVYEFYVKDPSGRYKSIFGEPIKQLTAGSDKEFQQLRKIHSHKPKYESDIKPVNRVLEAHYLHQNSPELHTVFFDIESAFDQDTGYSQPEDAANPIISIAVYLQWLNQVVCLAVPPQNLSRSDADAIAKGVGDVILYDTEREMLDAFLLLIDDADVLSGWNSEGYDIPYLVNRIHQTMGKAESRRLCLWNQLPKRREYKRGGKTEETYDLVGRVHLDYLQLYKKFSYEEKHSYSLDSIAEAELDEKKVAYEGTLDQLYHQDFDLFLKYNIQDAALVHRLDQKLQYIDLASSIAHGNCVLVPASLGAVAVTEQAIIIEAHSRGLRVPDRSREGPDENSVYDEQHADLEKRAAGGWVMTPKRGLHRWIGTSDLNSLYPSVIRACNMSPETLVGQIRTTETDQNIMDYVSQPGPQRMMSEWWNDRFNVLEMEYFYNNNNHHRLALDMADGSTVEVTGAEIRQLIFHVDNQWCITANGTIFRTDVEGIIPGLLSRWYSERKKMQGIKNDYDRLTNGIEIEHTHQLNRSLFDQYGGATAIWHDIHQVFSISTLEKKAQEKNSDELIKYMQTHKLTLNDDGKVVHRDHKELKKIVAFWDKRQLVRKINLNSVYGGLLNEGCRFYDKRIGQSTTLTGRSITRHMAAKTNEIADGLYDHNGRAIIYGDTDSTIFSVYPVLKEEIKNGSVVWNKDSVTELYDTIAKEVSDTFPNFMSETFNVPHKLGKVIKSGREIVGEAGLFITKKRYAILVYDEEGQRRDADGPGKLKITGLDIRRSDTPRFVQEFLRDVLLQTLTTAAEDAVIESIRKFKSEFKNLKPWQKGSPKAVNRLSYYGEQLEKMLAFKLGGEQAQSVSIPGHVRASINWNMLRERHNDRHSLRILDGQKVVVCKLKPNDTNMTSVAYPVDEPHLPDWFTSLPFDEEEMEKTIVDNKLENLLGVLKWDLSRASEKSAHFESLFDFN